MLKLSYHNVMNGLNKGINMTCLCQNQPETDYIFHNAIDLWYVEKWTRIKKIDRSIEYGPEGFVPVVIRFRTLHMFLNSNWRSFQGVFLIHPDLQYGSRDWNEIEAMNVHNGKYYDQWHN